MLKSGDTFLIPKSPTSTPHLYIVVTDPDPNTNEAVCVNVTTEYSISDKTVRLKRGDHPFIQYNSVISYANAELLDMVKVEAALNARITTFDCKRKAACDAALLGLIRQGILDSKFTPPKIKQYCKKVWRL